jgi:hypothetical protein
LADGWQVTGFEFLQPDHPISALRPAEGPLATMP